MLVKSNFFLKNRKKLILFLFLLIVVGIFIYYSKSRSVQSASGNITRQTAVAFLGDISTTITGSGTIVSSNKKTISSEVSGSVTAVNYKVGDSVSKGDILVTLDNTTLSSQIRDKQKSITTAKKNIEEIEKDINNLSVYTTKTGYVSSLNYQVGDTISKNSTLFQITDSSNYKISFSFAYNPNNPIQVGDTVSLFLGDTYTYISGSVSYVSQQKELANYGGQTQTVEITVADPGYTLVGVTARATISSNGITLQAKESATFESGDSSSFKSPVSGTIKELLIQNGDLISTGELVLIIENDDLYDNLADAKSNLSNLYEDLADINETAEFYTITSPIDGVITSLNVAVDDYVRSEASIATIVNNQNLEFSIDVDELDISAIEIGQEVNVTIDALSETASNPIIGTVVEIAIEGTSQNSVTTYPVTISFLGNESIRIGMSASAEIVTASKKDVVLVPVEAITSRRGKNYVTLVTQTNHTPTLSTNEVSSKHTAESLNSNEISSNPSKDFTNTNEISSNPSKDTTTNEKFTNRTGDFSTPNEIIPNENATSQDTFTPSKSNPQSNQNNANRTTVSANTTGIEVEVEIGLYNEDYIEIINGISAGDLVLLPEVVSGTSSKNSSKQNSNSGVMTTFTMPSGGSMPSGGGMPNGGGMPGGR